MSENVSKESSELVELREIIKTKEQEFMNLFKKAGIELKNKMRLTFKHLILEIEGKYKLAIIVDITDYTEDSQKNSLNLIEASQNKGWLRKMGKGFYVFPKDNFPYFDSKHAERDKVILEKYPEENWMRFFNPEDGISEGRYAIEEADENDFVIFFGSSPFQPEIIEVTAPEITQLIEKLKQDEKLYPYVVKRTILDMLLRDKEDKKERITRILDIEDYHRDVKEITISSLKNLQKYLSRVKKNLEEITREINFPLNKDISIRTLQPPFLKIGFHVEKRGCLVTEEEIEEILQEQEKKTENADYLPLKIGKEPENRVAIVDKYEVLRMDTKSLIRVQSETEKQQWFNEGKLVIQRCLDEEYDEENREEKMKIKEKIGFYASLFRKPISKTLAEFEKDFLREKNFFVINLYYWPSSQRIYVPGLEEIVLDIRLGKKKQEDLEKFLGFKLEPFELYIY